MSDLPIRAVLDASAVAAYGRGVLSVGEIIAEITDEHAGFAVPELCLIEAATRLDLDEWPALSMLTQHSHGVWLETPTDWRDVARAARLLGGMSRAVAMLAAVDHRAYLLTAEPDGYGDDSSLVIEI
ncbi:hypothetical protein [Plantactinospora sp. GCM10030261]|uniref:hypothetical protein n=1 Tax=Plantactinospora sp. GCM10030261 TaxID=3273420 RepID=UPI0036077AF5